MTKDTLVTLLIALIAGSFISFRRHTVANCYELIAELRPYLMAGLDRYTKDCLDTALATIWIDSRGLRGLWQRWRNAVIFVRICQLHGEFAPLNPAEMTEILERASALARASRLAAAWGTLRWLAPHEAAHATQTAVQQYYEMALETQAFLDSGGTYLCAKKLMFVL